MKYWSILIIIFVFVGTYTIYNLTKIKDDIDQDLLNQLNRCNNELSYLTSSCKRDDFEPHFGYLKTNADYLYYTWFLDKEASAVAQLPFLTEIYSNNDITILSADCFSEWSMFCSMSGLYGLKPITTISDRPKFTAHILNPANLPKGLEENNIKYLYTLDSSEYFTKVQNLLSPDKSKIIGKGEDLYVIDLKEDIVKNIFSIIDFNQENYSNEKFLWKYNENLNEDLDGTYIKNHVRWIDNSTIEFNIHKFKYRNDELNNNDYRGLLDTFTERKTITIEL